MTRTALDEIVVLRRQNDVLSERVAYLERKLPAVAEKYPREWSLTKKQSRVLGLLIRAEGRIVKRTTIMAAIWENSEPKFAADMITHMMRHIKKKVEPFGVNVRIIRGIGSYYIEKAPAELQAAE